MRRGGRVTDRWVVVGGEGIYSVVLMSDLGLPSDDEVGVNGRFCDSYEACSASRKRYR